MATKLEFVISAKDRYSKTFGNLRNSLPSLKTAALGIGVAVAGAGTALFALVKQTAAAQDSVRKFSDQLGVSTEFISKMDTAAGFAGVKIETVRKAMQQAQVQAGEAAMGNKLYAEAFDRLGVSITDANGKMKGSAELIPEMADGFANLSSEAEKSALAAKLFGLRGLEMLQIFKNGRAGLEAMTDEAVRFGTVISEQAANNAAEFNDALERVKISGIGLRNTLAEELMPVLTEMANRFANFVADNRPAIIDFGLTVIKVLGAVVEKGIFAAAVLIDAWRGWQMIIETMKLAFSSFVSVALEGFDFLTEKAIAFAETFNFTGVFDGFLENANKVSEGTKQIIDSMDAIAVAAFENLNSIIDEGSTVGKVETIKEKIKEALAEIQAAAMESTPVDEEGESPGLAPFNSANVKATEANIERLNEMFNEQFLSERERLTLWYEEQQLLFTGNEEALNKLRKIFFDKRLKLKLAENAALKKEDTKEIAQKSDTLGSLHSLSQSFGEKGKKLAQTLGIGRALISTYQGAAQALSQVPYPANLFAAAAVVANGLGQVRQVAAAHGGLDFVPNEQTFLLDRGERVLSPRQNEDLTSFLAGGNGDGGGTGQQINIENFKVSIMEDVTNPSVLMAMDEDDWLEITIEKIVPALNEAGILGVGIKATI